MENIKVLKRSGLEVGFDIEKIKDAIRKASREVDEGNSISESRIRLIANEVMAECAVHKKTVSSEMIQNIVENKLMELGSHDLVKKYMLYRYERRPAA